MRFSDIPQLTSSGSFIVTVPWDMLEGTLERFNENQNLRLDPEFQRIHVWDFSKQRRYVEYILRGGISGRDIYFNCASWMKNFNSPMYLVDGKQRLEAVRLFLRGGLLVFDYCFFEDFEDKLGFNAYFNFYVNNLETYKEVLQWYIELNDGGVLHTKEEIDKVRIMIENLNDY